MKDLMKLDLYELLNINACAPESEIKKAYRKKALICHPDKNPDNPKAVEDFKQLSKAVEILTDKVKRAKYDKVLRERKAAHFKLICVRITKVTTAANSARDKEEPRKSKEDRRKECHHRQDPKKRTPVWPPSSSKSKDKNENGPKQNTNQRGNSIHRKDTKRSVPTWPPSASKTQPKKKGGSRPNLNFQWNFSSILKPATFVAPSMSGSSNGEFNLFSRNQNQTGRSSGFSPLIKPATFVASSDNKTSTGFSWRCSSSILKPATFTAPSKS